MGNHQNKKLLIIGSVWPEPDSSAAGQRMMQLIALFQQTGWSITFASSSSRTKYATDLTSTGIEQVQVQLNSTTFDDFVHGLHPAAVLYDRFIIEEQFGWRVAEQCPGALRLLDTEDLHCLRRARKKALKEGRTFSNEDLLQNDTAKREIASILRCDLSLIISEYEMKLLQKIFSVDDSLLYYLPFLLDSIDDATANCRPTFNDRCHFIMVGNFRHPPNWDSVQYLYQHIWPKIRGELPKAQMHIYGAYPSKEAQNLHQAGKGFLIKGRVKDAKAALRYARVCLAPLRFGAGLKGKLVEAMACGTPSVTTPVGAEGLAGDMNWCGIIEQEPEKLAEAAVKLYTDQSLWKKAQQQGRRIINRRFTAKDRGRELINSLEKLSGSLQAHRRQNFMGAMLRHHSNASTKYMAKWIEAKNQK